MPIIVKDFNWRQTENTVTIIVPLRGVHSSKVDVFTSSRYIKLSYHPFFFDVLLLGSVDTTKSICTFTETHCTLELTKEEPIIWQELECLELNRAERNALKKQCIEEECKNIQNKSKERVGKFHELKRVAVRQAIKQDTQERELIAKRKTDEKNLALGNLSEWHDELENEKKQANDSFDTTTEEECESEEDEDEVITTQESEVKIKEPENPIRKTETLIVEFTKRDLPTPCRESRMEEENEWLKQQALARRSVGFASEDLKPEEKNPLYVKCKGDEFLKQGNYLGAISAFTFGIQLSPKFVDLYLGRLEAQFALGNFSNCAKDCSTALDLMKPEVPANLKQRITCIYKRGLSIFQLGFREQGANELQAAIRLDPNNQEMKDELEKMYDIIDDEKYK